MVLNDGENVFLCLEVVKEWSLSSTSKRDFWSSQEELKEDFEALKKKKNLLFDGATNGDISPIFIDVVILKERKQLEHFDSAAHVSLMWPADAFKLAH